jgi:multiple sugar transport system substrate-binding protein
MSAQHMTRRSFFRRVVLACAGVAAASLTGCGNAPLPTSTPQPPPTAQVVKETVVVPVKETVVVKETVAVPVKETVVVTQSVEKRIIQRLAKDLPYAVKQVYGGKPIKITVWDWDARRILYWKSIFAEYMALVPNVTIDMVMIPQADYWTKLMVALPAGQGPDVFAFHNAALTAFLAGKALAPYPESVFPASYMTANIAGFKEKHHLAIDGNLYYFPHGIMSSGIYYNKKIWKDAGLTEKDIPTTWDALVTIAKKLTKTDTSGKIVQAGFAVNTYEQVLWSDMNYQQGNYHFKPDAKHAYVNTPETKNAIQFIVDLWKVHKVNDPNFLSYIEAFGSGKAGMAYSWGFYGGVLDLNYPDVQWDFFPLPTFSGKREPAAARNNYDAGFSVFSGLPADKKAVVWDLLSWVYGDGGHILDLAMIENVVPARFDQQSNPRVLEHKIASKWVDQMPYTVYPGEFPQPWLDQIKKYLVDAVFLAGTSIDAAMKQAEEEGDKVLGAASYLFMERTYANAKVMKSP